MASVDDRIVRMEFDNAAFERKVSTTLSSIDQLNKALKFEGAKDGLSGIQGMADKFNLGSMGTHIEGVSAKFLALGTMAVTVLSNITNKAISAGTQIVKSLALDGIMAGFSEYELKLGSIQTIMAGSGASLDEVNKKLQELNTYSDKTIYSFKDMTSNIGKFTNAGVDLNTSVKSIQGVANVAAVSGANAEEASRAMYNFAQALSKGSVALIDWKSIELANMGTVEFKQQLIDAAVAQGQLTAVGDHYVTSVGKSVTATQGFNDSLTDQWLTTDVLTKTLGDYADETTAIGKKAFAAAQDIKTFSQLMDTTKEAIGSGWAQTFEILVGNFDEAKLLWSGLGKVIGDFVGKSADSRNQLLQTWKDMGGRSFLFVGLVNAFKDLQAVINPIKEAFRDIFPPMTGLTLFDLTKRFAAFMEALKPGEKAIENLHRIFKGFFAILEIGWEVIKRGVGFIGDLISAISDAGGGSFLSFLAKIGDFFVKLNDILVGGGGIKNFFEVLAGAIAVPIALIGDLKDKVLEFFGVVSKSDIPDKAGESFGRFKDRLESLSEIFDKITALWEPVKKALLKIKDIFDEVIGELKQWFGTFLDTLADVFKSGDFNKILDALNVGLFGGLLLVMNKFINKGIKINATLQGFFGGGLFEKIGKSFDALTGTLQSMQTKIKAEALMKIAEAIGILTASVLVLSMIDSGALTKALTAMAVGFGQLMGAFAILNAIDTSTTGNLKFTLIAAGMIILSTAIVILAAAVKIFSSIGAEELVTGLAGMSAALAILLVAIQPLAKQSPMFILASVGLIAIGVALTILAGAVKLFSMMDWAEMGKGFIAVGAGLLIIAGAMQLMPNTMILSAAGLVAIGISLNMIAGALKIYATMSWGEIGKGLTVLAGALVAIGLAMNLMPTNMLLTAPALVAVGYALTLIGAAMKIMGSMSWGEVARGLTAMAAALVVLAVATTAMSGSIPGAIAIGIVAGSLLVLGMVLKEFALIKWDELIHGLVGIAAVLITLGLVAMGLSEAILPLMGLGAALILIGGAFALFGVGVTLVTEGLALFVSLGPKAGKALVDFLTSLGKAIPALAAGLGKGLIEMVQSFLDGAAPLVDAAVKLLGLLLDGLTKLIPKAIVVITELITGLLDVFNATIVPLVVASGIGLIMALLQGIRDHIDDIIIIVGEIVTNFLDALSTELPKIVTSVANLFINLLTSVAEAVGRVSSTLMIGLGISFIDGFMQGITQSATSGPVKWFTELPAKILEWIGDVAKTLWEKGGGFITGFLGGIVEKAKEVTTFFQGIGKAIIGWIGDALSFLKDIGGKIITGLFNGIKEIWTTVGSWFDGIANMIKYHIPNPLRILWDVGVQIVQGFLQGIQSVWHTVTDWVSNAIDGVKHLWTSAKGFFTGSPSRFTAWVGEMVIAGFTQPFENDTSMERNIGAFVDKSAAIFKDSITAITSGLGDITEFQPTITPVLDLTEVKAGAQKISDYISTANIPITASYDQANAIATSPSNVITPPVDTTSVVPAGVKFEQNIYAPTQLSTSDIYKQTRNQIAMAKEALSIP